MANYLNPETGEYPLHDGDIQLLFSNWVNGQPLPEPWVEVEETPAPILDEYETYDEDLPKKVNDKWVRSWKVRPMTADEKLRHDNPYPTTPTQFGHMWDDKTSSWIEINL